MANEPMQDGPQRSEASRHARREKLDQRVRADLWKAVWEATQTMTYQEIREHVDAVLVEIQADEP